MDPDNVQVVSEAEQKDKQNDPEPADVEQAANIAIIPTTPNQEQNNNLNKSPLTLESLESLGAQDTVQSTLDCQLVLNRVRVEFPMGANSLALPITRGTILYALTNLGLDLQIGALVGATPLGEWTRNMTRMPIILTFDSRITRNAVLKAAIKKDLKGPGAFPIFDEEKLYFSEVKKRRPKANRSNAEEKVTTSDTETAEMRENLLRSQGQNRKGNKVESNPEKQTGQDEGPKTQDDLASLTEQVTRIIPQSRIDTAAALDDLARVTRELASLTDQVTRTIPQSRIDTTAEELTSNLPMEVLPEEDLRDHLNERNGVVEVEITHNNLITTAEDLSQLDPEADLRRVLKARRKSGVGPCVTSENLATALAKATSRLLTDEQKETLQLDMIRRLRDKIDGIITTDTDSDTQGEPGLEDSPLRRSNPTLKKLGKVLGDISRRKAEKKSREESNNPTNKTDNQQLADQEDGELSNEDMINVVDHSDFDDSPRVSGDGMRPIAQSSTPITRI